MKLAGGTAHVNDHFILDKSESDKYTTILYAHILCNVIVVHTIEVVLFGVYYIA